MAYLHNTILCIQGGLGSATVTSSYCRWLVGCHLGHRALGGRPSTCGRTPFGLTQYLVPCGRHRHTTSGHLHCNIIPGCLVQRGCATHVGEGLAVFHSLQEALHCHWGPGITPASSLHHGSAGMLCLWAFLPPPGHAPMCPQQASGVMAPYVMMPYLVVLAHTPHAALGQ